MKSIHSLFLLLLCITFSVNAQTIKVRQDNQQAIVEEIAIATYDGESPTFDLQLLKQHPDYYNGWRILFLPNVERAYDFIEGFTIDEEVYLHNLADTVWNKSRTKIKKVTIPSSDVYKPMKVCSTMVKVFDSGNTLYSAELMMKTGIFTSVDDIEGRTFTVRGSKSQEIQRSFEETLTEFDIYLTDEEGTNLTWHIVEGLLQKVPVIMCDFLKEYEQQVGKTFVYTRKNIYGQHSLVKLYFGDDYNCTDFCLAKSDYYSEGRELGHYYMPALFFDHMGEEIRYDIISNIPSTLVGTEDSITHDEYDAMVEKDVYLAQLQAEENARKQRQNEIIADFVRKNERKNEERKKQIAEERARQEKENAAAVARAKQARKKEAAAAAERRAAKYAQLIAAYGQVNADLMMYGKVKIGWTTQMCRESWGSPRKINRTTTAYGVDEQWVYYKGYLYFTDGILRAIQD